MRIVVAAACMFNACVRLYLTQLASVIHFVTGVVRLHRIGEVAIAPNTHSAPVKRVAEVIKILFFVLPRYRLVSVDARAILDLLFRDDGWKSLSLPVRLAQ